MGNPKHFLLIKEEGGDRRNLETGATLDLSGDPLSGLDLRERHFERTNFRNSNLSWSKLDRACLGDADLTSANLMNTWLSFTDLRDSRLVGAKLDEAKLAGADLRRSDLTNADLAGAQGLRVHQLGGAVLVGAKLPEAIKQFEGLSRVRDLTRGSAATLVPALLACAYVWLTLGTTSDAKLLLNSSSSTLPVLNASLPILLFFYAAPLLLLVFHVSLGLYLQRLSEALAALPAVFPDGARLDERVNPWLLNGLIYQRLDRLRDESPPFASLQSALSLLLAYWTIPISLTAVWLGCAGRRDVWLTGFQVLVLAVAIGVAWEFQRLCDTTLRGLVPLLPSPGWTETGRAQRLIAYFRRWWRGWSLGVGTALLATVILAVTTRSPHAYYFFTPDLTGEDLRAADLRGADLHAARFDDADLAGARLEGAELFAADLRRARNLTAVQAKSAARWRSAFLPPSLLQPLGLPPGHNRQLALRLAGQLPQ